MRADVVVVGSGVAGLTAAVTARQLGLRVLVVTKAAALDGNTRWAQGGVAVVTGDGTDTVDRHAGDTVHAGAGLCDELAVRTILADGPAAVRALRRRGAVFDRDATGRLARTREGGHSALRVIHAGGDATGTEIERALLVSASAITMLEHHAATEVLLTEDGAVAGLSVLSATGEFGELSAPAVLLATGGLGQLYTATTNPEVATGDGLALALAAGATAVDLEFVQFHPTVLYSGPTARGRRPLVTEALRGEGAVLVDGSGRRVMAGVHPLTDLAPRDVVSAAINRRIAETGAEHVYLDATHLDDTTFARRFPTVLAACRAAGIQPAREPIPVAPAAHYACGGVDSTVDGRTDVVGLYVAGELARTGLHGANRLASNSLLEGLVVGTRAATAVAADLEHRVLLPGRPAESPSRIRGCADRALVQRMMSRHAGIGRDHAGLTVAATAIDQSTLDRPMRTRRDVEDAALTLVAAAVLAAATTRTETRGCHVRTDFPATQQRWRRAVAVRCDEHGRPIVVGEPQDIEGAA